MPPSRVPLRAAERAATAWIVTAVPALTARVATADHGGPVSGKGGLDWMTWLLLAGAVAAVSLAAWAFFAPDRAETRRTPPTDADASEPEPPAR
jgi:hypothetical protein